MMKQILCFCLILLFPALFIPRCRYIVLPENRPQKFTISYNKHAGMLPVSETIYISSKKCHYESRYNDLQQKFDFTLTEKELDSLYQFLKKNRIGSISSGKIDVTDRGGTIVTVGLGKKSFSISDSGIFIVTGRWRSKWQMITKHIEDTALQKIPSTTFQLISVNMIGNKTKNSLWIQMNNRNLYKKDKFRQPPPVVYKDTFTCQKMKYNLHAHINVNGRFKHVSKIIDFNTQVKSIRVKFYKDKIIIE